MKLLSSPLEKLLIKIILTSPASLSHYAVGKLTPEHFHYDPAKEFFQRIQGLAKTRHAIPTYYEVIDDPVISEPSRKAIAAYRKKVKTVSKKIIDRHVASLNEYRQLRQLYYCAENLIIKLKEDKVDLEELTNGLADTLNKVKNNTEEAFTIVNFGVNENAQYLIKNLLSAKTRACIPTGFKAFDNANGGFFFGSLVLLYSNTAGGKSTLALNMGINMALYGAKVCYVPLEQGEEEKVGRMVSKIAHVNMSKIIKPDNLNESEKSRIISSYKKFNRILKKKDAQFTLFKPKEDVSIEDLFFHIKPLGYNVIFIDYLTLLKGMDGKDQWQLINKATRAAKIYAENNNCIVVLLAQLGEDGNTKFSKSIIDHTNNAWYWQRDKKAKETHILTMIQKKARNQKDFTFHLVEDFEHMLVRDLKESEKAMVEGLGDGELSSKSFNQQDLRKRRTTDQNSQGSNTDQASESTVKISKSTVKKMSNSEDYSITNL